ncbi:unnamed protein product, partial [Meganyctiphanes norvegica]
SFPIINDPAYYEIFNHLSNSNQQLIFIFLGTVNQKSQENLKESLNTLKRLMTIKEFKAIIGSVEGRDKNAALITSDLRQKIKIHLDLEHIAEKYNWETISKKAHRVGIRVDEDIKFCKDSKKLAENTISYLKSDNVTTLKREVLPLQGDLWSEWSRLSKELVRPEMSNVEFISKIEIERQSCRKDQFDLVQNMSPAMKDFIKNLMETKIYPEYQVNFMQWMKINLDERSHITIPDLQNKYHKLWCDLQDNRNKKDDNQINETENKLEKVERDIMASSLGLEHFMRELGQVYEAVAAFKDNSSYTFKKFELLPQVAADLLLSGFPLEIMDGDAAHMPLTWVKSVFDELTSRLGDMKVFVISVLGIQSSGKSTLLNTMFGLNFAVSAGRCTKGVFAQLIPIENPLNGNLGYDYILILDTEGLRAPELGKTKLNHDNELATLVIGMGDVTIVNIKGENTAEIEDILQIAVHAFLRMQLVNKSLKLQPGCYFVHQNVPAVNASEKMLYGYEKIQQKLDDITIAAAEHEHAREIQSFRDVIDFDVQHNVFNFTSLWQGDPPMAPANPSYSMNVLNLKSKLLMYPSKKEINCLTFSDLKARMNDLWKAILNENFVFSFKNSLEVKSYSRMEEKYASLSWEFRNEVKEWLNGSINEIQTCEEKDIASLQTKIISNLNSFINENFLKYQTDLDNFFANAKDKDIIIQWQENRKHKLKELSEELESEVQKTCDGHFTTRRAKCVGENEAESYEKDFYEHVKGLVNKYRAESISEESLNKEFAEEWNKKLNKLKFKKLEEKNISSEVFNILQKNHRQDSLLLNDQFAKYDQTINESCKLDDQPIIDKSDFRTGWGSYLPSGKSKNDIIFEIGIFTGELLKDIQSYLDEKKNNDYEKNFVYEIQNKVSDQIHQFNKDKKGYKLLKTYNIKLIVHIFRNVIPIFINMHAEYRIKNDPKHILEEDLRPRLQKYFVGTVKNFKQDETAADILSTSLEKSVLKSLKRKLPQKIANKVRDSDDLHHRYHTKANLYAKILEDLGTGKQFGKYINFIKDYKGSVRTWLKLYVSEYCKNDNGNNNLAEIATGVLEDIVSTLKDSVPFKDVNSTVKPKGISYEKWLEKYHCNIKRAIPLKENIFKLLDKEQINEICFFEEKVLEGLDNIKINLEKLFPDLDIDQLDEKPYMLLGKTLFGCTEQCPFCKSICTLNEPNHEGSHINPFHQPQGIGGYKDKASKILCLESCNVLVAGKWLFECNDPSCKCHNDGEGHAYKKYKDVNETYASWSITPDNSMDGTEYWKWVFCQFPDEFANYYAATAPNMPEVWSQIEWKDAKKSILEEFNI